VKEGTLIKHLSMVLCLVLFVTAGVSAGTRHVWPDGTGDAPTIRAGIDSTGVAIVMANMCTVQLAFEDFAVRTDGYYPTDSASTTPQGQTVEDLCPDINNDGIGDWPINPFTGCESIFSWDADPCTAGDIGDNPGRPTSYRIKGCGEDGDLLPFELRSCDAGVPGDPELCDCTSSVWARSYAPCVGDTVEIYACIVDCYCTPLNCKSVAFYSTRGADDQILAMTAFTDANGVAGSKMTTMVPGASQFYVVVQGIQFGPSPAINWSGASSVAPSTWGAIKAIYK
jgi:hypothetical protein